MDFNYCRTFGGASPEAYERLLLDVMVGDATLFMRRDSVEMSWHWIAPILDRWAEQGAAPCPYPAGTCGPPEVDRLIEETGRSWRPV
jgi:glucose-6-phosphate 1-dehydrogenase